MSTTEPVVIPIIPPLVTPEPIVQTDELVDLYIADILLWCQIAVYYITTLVVIVWFNRDYGAGPVPIGTFVPSTFLTAVWIINKTQENLWDVFRRFYHSFKFYNIVYFVYFDFWASYRLYSAHGINVAEICLVGILVTQITYFYSTDYVLNQYIKFIDHAETAAL